MSIKLENEIIGKFLIGLSSYILLYISEWKRTHYLAQQQANIRSVPLIYGINLKWQKKVNLGNYQGFYNNLLFAFCES